MAKAANDTLGKDDFLKILITQLTHQNPLEPMEDKEFIAQMAQFSSLEQMTNVAASMESLANFSMINAVSFIDRTVAYVDGDGSIQEAAVTGVAFESGAVVLTLDNDSAIYLDSVVAVS
jgi:flagellar basal-body rod modification protein FlgD